MTHGTWETEEESATAFDRALAASGLAERVYDEVDGQYLWPRLGWKDSACRIDRIVIPSAALIRSGWPHGPIGIEIEASRRKVAGPLEQLLDYTRAVWTIKKGFHIVLEWFFLWPWGNLGGNVGSLANNQRIGGVMESNYSHLTFHVCGMNAIRSVRGTGLIEARELKVGLKKGHRAKKG